MSTKFGSPNSPLNSELLMNQKGPENDDLLKFYNNVVLPGPVDFQIHKNRDFFANYRLQSNDFETFVMRNQEEEVDGLCSLVFREGFLENEYQKVAFLTDLRISNHVSALKSWSQEFLPFLRKACLPRKVKYAFSVVSPVENQAYNLLIRPKRVRTHLPRYILIQSLEVIAVHGITPFFNPLKTLSIKTADLRDYQDILNYLMLRSKNRLLSFDYNEKLISDRFNQWPWFKLNNFLVARDSHANIVGVCSLWNSSEVLRYKAIKYNGFAETVRSLFAWGSWTGWVNKLPHPPSYLDFMFVNQFYADNTDVAQTLIYNAFQLCKSNEFLVYPRFEYDLLRRPSKSFVTSKTPLGLYLILPPEEEIPKWLPLSQLGTPPELDLCFL
jgi:hypothetical protein